VSLATRPGLLTPPAVEWGQVEKRDEATIDLLA
jgi:hypothetical protein